MITFSRDLAERVLSTFAQAFLGVFAAANLFSAGNELDVSELRQLAGAGVSAGIAAVLALMKGLAARNIGENGTASLAPVVRATPQYDLTGVTTVDVTEPPAGAPLIPVAPPAATPSAVLTDGAV